MMRRETLSTSRHRGYTIVEMCLLVAMVGLLLATSANILRQAFGVHERTVQHVLQMRSLEQLRTNLIQDVQAAESANIENDRLVLRGKDRWNTSYELRTDKQGEHCVRIRSAITDPETILEERCVLPTGSKLKFEMQSAGEGRKSRSITCTIEDWMPDPVQWLLSSDFKKGGTDD